MNNTQQRELWEMISINSPVALAQCNSEDEIEWVNPYFCSLFGFSEKELLKTKIFNLVEESEKVKFREAYDFIKSGIVNFTLDCAFYHKSASHIHLKTILCPSKENRDHFYLCCFDITSEKLKQKRLTRRTEELKMAKSIHELTSDVATKVLSDILNGNALNVFLTKLGEVLKYRRLFIYKLKEDGTLEEYYDKNNVDSVACECFNVKEDLRHDCFNANDIKEWIGHNQVFLGHITNLAESDLLLKDPSCKLSHKCRINLIPLKMGYTSWGFLGIVYEPIHKIHPISEELKTISSLIMLLISQKEKVLKMEKEIKERILTLEGLANVG